MPHNESSIIGDNPSCTCENLGGPVCQIHTETSMFGPKDSQELPKDHAWELNRYPIFLAIQTERNRQDELVKAGKFAWTMATDFLGPDPISLDRKMTILSEETGEVAKEVCDYGIAKDKYELEGMPFPRHRHRYFLEHLRNELVQVAACCVAWIESIDRLIAEYSD